MSKSSQLRAEVLVLREKVRETLVTAALKAAPAVISARPEHTSEGKLQPLGAVQWANLRWEFLKAEFTYFEIQQIMSRLKAWVENNLYPHNDTEFATLVEQACLGSDVTDATNHYTLWLLQARFNSRLNEPLYSGHERAVLTVGKRIRKLIEGKDAEQETFIVKDLAAHAKVQPEMVWRVATGGTKVTSVILANLDRRIRQHESAESVDNV